MRSPVPAAAKAVTWGASCHQPGAGREVAPARFPATRHTPDLCSAMSLPPPPPEPGVSRSEKRMWLLSPTSAGDQAHLSAPLPHAAGGAFLCDF